MDISKEWTAVILAGGFGTRLRPLTTNICKPMVKVTNKSMVDFAIDHLRYAGIKRIIVCVKHLGDLLRKQIIETWGSVMEEEDEFNIEIPKNDSKGTADAVRKIWDYIETDYFIVSMADIITNLPAKDFMQFHMDKKADSTISMKPIDEFATKYGNTVINGEGRIQLFLEKPSPQEIFLSSLAGQFKQTQEVLPIINTGIYCFTKDCAQQSIMQTNFMDFGKEIFPYLLENNYNLYGFVENYYWMDVGNPKTYLWANWDILREYGWPIMPNGEDLNNKKIWWSSEPIHPPSTTIEERVCLGNNIFFDEDVKIGTLTVLGNNVKIGKGTTIDHSVIWDNVEIGDNCKITETVVADGCQIGDNVELRTETIIGPNVTIGDGVLLDSRTIDGDTNISKKDKH